MEVLGKVHNKKLWTHLQTAKFLFSCFRDAFSKIIQLH